MFLFLYIVGLWAIKIYFNLILCDLLVSWWNSFYFGLPFTVKAEVYKHSLVTRPSAVGGVANRMLNRLLHIIRQAVSSWILTSCEPHRVTSGWITHSELSCNISKHVTKSQVCQIHCYSVIQNTFLPLQSITKSQVCQIHCYNVIQNSFAPLQDMLLNHKFVKFSVENQPSLYLGIKRTCYGSCLYFEGTHHRNQLKVKLLVTLSRVRGWDFYSVGPHVGRV